MSKQTSARLAWSFCIVSALCSSLALVFSALNPYNPAFDGKLISGIVCLAVLYPIFGALIASRQPQNPIGWIFCIVGLLQGINFFSGQYGRYVLLIRPGALPAGPEIMWLEFWTWIPSLALLVTF